MNCKRIFYSNRCIFYQKIILCIILLLFTLLIGGLPLFISINDKRYIKVGVSVSFVSIICCLFFDLLIYEKYNDWITLEQEKYHKTMSVQDYMDEFIENFSDEEVSIPDDNTILRL